LKPVLKEKDSDDPAGTIIAIKPAAGTAVAPGSKVKLYYSAGPKQIPNVVGLDEGTATSILEKAGFKVTSVPDSSSTKPKGTVTRQIPDAGTPQNQGTTVTILVSTYVEPTQEPTPSDTSSPTDTASPADE
ncbi:MAG TPA: PASTA domain-containing protein, partial [Marmoricola sp.]